jgi:outer membrane protein assembly factor BamB
MKRIGLFLTVGTLLFLAQLSHLSGAQPGEKLWEFELFEGGLWTCPAIGTDGTVYVGAHDSKVYALHGATGQKRWEFPTAGLVQSSPAIGADGTLYVGSRGVVSELGQNAAPLPDHPCPLKRIGVEPADVNVKYLDTTPWPGQNRAR